MSQHIFVFASNLAGIHGKGSAKAAKQKHGAQYGVGSGRTGNAYAIPTKETWRDKGMPLDHIRPFVNEFRRYAKEHPELEFDVVRVGCGLVGYHDEEMAPLFHSMPDNVNLPFGWRELAVKHQ